MFKRRKPKSYIMQHNPFPVGILAVAFPDAQKGKWYPAAYSYITHKSGGTSFSMIWSGQEQYDDQITARVAAHSHITDSFKLMLATEENRLPGVDE